jgi:hypothetical protein
MDPGAWRMPRNLIESLKQTGEMDSRIQHSSWDNLGFWGWIGELTLSPLGCSKALVKKRNKSLPRLADKRQDSG